MLRTLDMCAPRNLTGTTETIEQRPSITFTVSARPVSYTHLDVYKRQGHTRTSTSKQTKSKLFLLVNDFDFQNLFFLSE